MRKWKFGWPLVCVLLALSPGAARSQAVRAAGNQPRIKPGPLILLGSITVSASPSVVNFALVSRGVATGSSPIVVTTGWGVLSLLSSLKLYGYFSSATAALSGGSPVVNIPSSCVLGQVPTGAPTSYTAFTQSGPFGGAGASLLLFSDFSILTLLGSRTDNLNLKIDLTSLPQLPAASYHGTLYLEAQAF